MDEKKQVPESAHETVTLDMLPLDGERFLTELREGNMVIVRSKNDFLYVLEFGGQYHMFSHTPGAPGGGQQRFPVSDKYDATVRKLANLSDSAYLCIFERKMNLYGVLQSAEDGILAMFPGDIRDADGDVEFAPWDRAKDKSEKKEKSEKMPTDGVAGADFPSENFDDLFKIR